VTPERFFLLFEAGVSGMLLALLTPLSFGLTLVLLALCLIARRARLNKLSDL
jgi:hypothetical protein